MAPTGKLPRCPTCGLALVSGTALADADGDPFLGTTVADRFVVTGRVGAGSMGTVYRARQEAMGRDVAIKILRSDRAFDAQAKARFTREARAMSLLVSPHTVTVFDFGEIPDPAGEVGAASLYLAMELLEGESLGTRLKRRKRVPIDDAVRIARHALSSLAEAHEKGVIHRDLKPDNLFLAAPSPGDDGETCKVLDFGIAKVLSDGAAVDALETQAGTVFGTPRYMSPEQAQGKALDARSDLYSLGVLLYQMLVGRAPFVDDDAVVVMARHIKTMPVAPAIAAPELAIPPSISEVVMRALAKDPGDRPGSARAFITQLEQAAARPRSDRPPHDDVTAASGELGALSRDDLATAGAEARRAPRRRPVVWLGSAALVVVAAGLGATALARSPLALLTARGGLEFAVLTRAAQVRTAATEVAVAPEAPASAASYEAPPPPPPAAATGASKVGHPKGEHKPTKQRYRRFDQ